MLIYILIGWYLTGLIPALFTNIYMNKDIYGNWFITLGDLVFSLFIALGGITTFIACIIICISWFLKDKVNWDKAIWKKK